jgi:nucleoid DNA-binding protein
MTACGSSNRQAKSFRFLGVLALSDLLEADFFRQNSPAVVETRSLNPIARRTTIMANAASAKKPLTKTELVTNIAAEANVSKKEVAAVLDALANQIKNSLGNKGAGVIAIPGLVKIEKKKVAARKAQKNVPDPFHPGQFRDVAAKPAYNKVKVRALKTLKDMAK